MPAIAYTGKRAVIPRRGGDIHETEDRRDRDSQDLQGRRNWTVPLHSDGHESKVGRFLQKGERPCPGALASSSIPKTARSHCEG